MGAGGIGSYLGAMLARSGVDVTLICRGRHLEAIRSHGLALSTPKETFCVEVKAGGVPQSPVDLVIQAVKLYDLASSTQQMLPMVGPKTTVLPIQNGVTAAEEIAAVVGAEKVIGGTLFINAHVVSPGAVSSKSEINTVAFGEFDRKGTPRVEVLKNLFANAGIDARISPDIKAEQWRKFIPVAGLSALSCLCRQPIGPIREDPALRKLYRQAMAEVAALAAAKGVARSRI